MTFLYPFMLAVAAVGTAAAVWGYVTLQKRRTALSTSGLGIAGSAGRASWRRHLPYAFFLGALPLLLVGMARPQATVDVPRVSGTVILVFDVSNSMSADDVKPSRLQAAQAAALSFVEAQPSTVDIGVVVFGQEALMTQEPAANHHEAIAAIKRLKTNGGTSLGTAILASLSTIIGRPVSLPSEDSPEPPPDLGYWSSATIVLFSDGEDNAGPDVELAAGLAADAGVRIQTIGVGTTEGDTIEVDGFQLATALNEELLNNIATATGGSYRQAQDADSLNEIAQSIDLRITTHEEPVELTAVVAAVALVLLTIGGLLMTRWHGRIV